MCTCVLYFGQYYFNWNGECLPLKRNRRVRLTPASDPSLISEQNKWTAGACYEIGVRRHKPFWQIKLAQWQDQYY